MLLASVGGMIAAASMGFAAPPDVVLSEDGMTTMFVGDVVAEVGENSTLDPAACTERIHTWPSGQNPSSGWTIIDPGVFGSTQYPGIQFTLPDDTLLCEIEFTGGHVLGTNDYFVRLLRDAGGVPDCTDPIGVWNIGALDPFDGIDDTPKSTGDISGAGIILTAGTPYWVAVYTAGLNDAWGASNLSLDVFTYQLGVENDSGCINFGDTNPGCWRIFGDEPSAGLELGYDGSCPGDVRLPGSGATGGGLVALVFSPNLGACPIPSGPCAGTVLDLDCAGAFLVTTTVANADGTFFFGGFAPPFVCGGYVQALDVATCTTSNTQQIL